MNQCLEAYEGMWLDNPGFKKSLINYNGPGVTTPGSFHFTYNEERKYKGLYYMGDMSLLQTPLISVIGSRNAPTQYLKKAWKLSRLLCLDGFTPVSGMARGVDEAVHRAALLHQTVGVLGTPINRPPRVFCKSLYLDMKDNHLLISICPIHWGEKDWKKFLLKERSKYMAALCLGTVVVHMEEGSGTYGQAKEAEKIGRPLFILSSIFDRWKDEFPDAIRLRNGKEVIETFKEIFHA